MSYPLTSVHGMNPERLRQRLERGHLQNVDFDDFVRLVEFFGWAMDRQRGSHQVFRHPLVAERLNLQPDRNGQAKPYQIREFMRYLEDYHLGMEEQ
jgi:predicted RNA binding protein YcfA (HicA-like mRNA interferase family)